MTEYIGILRLNSKTVYGITKNKSTIREFIPIYPKSNIKLYVATKRQYQSKNLYVYVKRENDTLNICEYIGEIGNLDTELEVTRRIAMLGWTNNRKFIDLQNYITTDLTPDRVYIDKNIFTIDPENCLDIDDALHIEEFGNYYEIGIHIADVSSYIPVNSELDIELRGRAESIYLPHMTINMMPVQLATELCSLRKDKISRSYSVIVKLSKDNLVIQNVSFVKSNIMVNENLSYEEAKDMLKTNSILNLLYEVGCKINEKTYKLERYDIHKMIEVYMLLANQLVANKISDQNNFLIRVHNGCSVNKASYADIDDFIFNKFKLLNTDRAEYMIATPETKQQHKLIGDGILYTHFTSPIRRYADIIVHRMLYGIEQLITHEQVANLNNKHLEYNKYEKIAHNLSKIYQISEMNKSENIYDATIIDLTDSKCAIYINKLEMIVNFKIMPDLIQNLFLMENKENKLIIINKDNFDQIELKLFQKIKIKISISLNKWKKINIQIIDPTFGKLYYEETQQSFVYQM